MWHWEIILGIIKGKGGLLGDKDDDSVIVGRLK